MSRFGQGSIIDPELFSADNWSQLGSDFSQMLGDTWDYYNPQRNRVALPKYPSPLETGQYGYPKPYTMDQADWDRRQWNADLAKRRSLEALDQVFPTEQDLALRHARQMSERAQLEAFDQGIPYDQHLQNTLTYNTRQQPALVSAASRNSPPVRASQNRTMGSPSVLARSTAEDAPPRPAVTAAPVQSRTRDPYAKNPVDPPTSFDPRSSTPPSVGGGERRRADQAARTNSMAAIEQSQANSMAEMEKRKAQAQLDARIPQHVQRDAKSMGYQGDFSDFNAETYKDMKNWRRGERAREYGERRAQARANVRAKIRPRLTGTQRNQNRTRFGHVPLSTPRHILDAEERRRMLQAFGQR